MRNSRLLKQRMQGKWLDAFAYLAGESLGPAIKKLGENVTCPIDGDIEGFRLLNDANDSGGSWKQNLGDQGAFPDGITTLMNVTDRGFKEVFDMLSDWLDGNLDKKDSDLYSLDQIKPALPKAPQTKIQDETELKAWLNRLWGESIDLDNSRASLGKSYLESRRIYNAALQVKGLRFHPNLKFTHERKTIGYYPGLTAIVRDNHGTPIGIHRTYLDKHGNKLSLPQTKATRKKTPTVGNTKGRVVALTKPEHGVLGIAEGLETSLSIISGSGVPVWSCLSASFMPQFVPPQGVHTVIIFVDVDKSVAGQKAAHKLKENLEDMGIRVILLAPLLELSPDAKSVDWADQYITDLHTGSKAMMYVKQYYQSLIK